MDPSQQRAADLCKVERDIVAQGLQKLGPLSNPTVTVHKLGVANVKPDQVPQELTAERVECLTRPA